MLRFGEILCICCIIMSCILEFQIMMKWNEILFYFCIILITQLTQFFFCQINYIFSYRAVTVEDFLKI